MGLDLYHVIPSKKTEQTTEYFSLEDFEDNPNFLLNHEYLIEELEEYEYNFEILIFPDINTKALVLDSNKDKIFKPILVGNILNLTDAINKITEGKDININESFVLNHTDNLLSEKHKREITYSSIFFADNKPIKKQVLYWEEKGYQRKGMNEHFYKDFKNEKNYYDIGVVQKAFSYLEPTWGNSKEELKNSFKEAFIDNFIEGQSIFFASW